MNSINSHAFLSDKDIIHAALERTIKRADGALVTNMAFALHLFDCARDMLPFPNALNLYGYTKKNFNKELIVVFKRCYEIGVSHRIRELTAKLARGDGERAVTLDNLHRVYALYPDPTDSGNDDKTYEFLIRQKDKKNLKGLVK